MAEVTFVYSEHGDWEGMYADDAMVEQGHRIPAADAMSHMVNAQIENVKSFTVSSRWLEAQLGLPDSLTDIPKEVIV